MRASGASVVVMRVPRDGRLIVFVACGSAAVEPEPQRGPHNDELQRTSDGTAAGSPLNSVFDGRQTLCRAGA